MKNAVVFALAATVVGLTAVCVIQSRQLAGQKQVIAAMQAEGEERTQQVARLESAQERAAGQRRLLLKQADDLAAQLMASSPGAASANAGANAAAESLPATPAASPTSAKSGFGSFLSQMMKNPDTKKFIAEQQRMMVQQMYNPLIKQLGMTTEEGTRFKDLLADNMVSAAEKATSLFGAESGTNHLEVVNSMDAEQKAFDEKVKAFLGDERYAQYKDYQETVGERTQLNLFRQQAGTDNALSDQQADQLLAFMKEEKKYASDRGETPASLRQDKPNLAAALSSEQTEKLLQSQELINQRVYDRARTILSPDQMESFGRFQTNQLQMMRAGMSMARQLMAPDRDAEVSPAPSQ